MLLSFCAGLLVGASVGFLFAAVCRMASEN